MTKFTKYLILGTTLIIPVFIYIFLELFGSNQFSIPIYHQEEIPHDLSLCSEVQIPHKVDLSRFSVAANNNHKGKIVIINPVVNRCFDCLPNLNEIKRVFNKHNEINVVSFYEIEYTSVSQGVVLPDGWDTYGLLQSELIDLMRCQLLLDTAQAVSFEELTTINRLVLVDPDNRIRGYYDKSDREDIDRLIVELTILKKEYSNYE